MGATGEFISRLPPNQTMEEEITKAIVEGTLSPETIAALESKLSEAGKEELKKAQAFATKRRDEESKAKKSEGEPVTAKADDTGIRFRNEQVEIAKGKFFAQFGIPAEKQGEYEETFKRLDSGKVSAELIIEDLKGVHAFLNRDSLLTAQEQQRQMEANAAAANAAAAGPSGSAPSTTKREEHSDEAVALSKEAGVDVTKAEEVLARGGTTRVLG